MKKSRGQKNQKQLYPGVKEAEEQRNTFTGQAEDEEPDFIGNAPNYDKFKGWSTEEVLVWLNID